MDIENIIRINERKILALIFLAALALRIFAVINLPQRYQTPAVDAQEFDKLAMNILSGKGFAIDTNAGKAFITDGKAYPTSWRVPLYPIFLAVIYSTFGHNYFVVRIIQAIMSALLCIIIFYIAQRAFNLKIALLSATILVFYQPLIFYLYFGGPVFLFSENLFIFLFALFLLFLIKNLFENNSLENIIISGFLMGLLVLTRPFIALFPLLLFILFLYKNKYAVKPALKTMFMLLFVFILTILPWTVRNYFVQKAFVPISTEGGFALLSGNNPSARGGGVIDVTKFLTNEERNSLDKMSEFQRDQMYRSHAREFLLKNYKIIPRLFFKKLLVLWDVFGTDHEFGGVRVFNIWYSVILIFALFGIFKFAKLNIYSMLLFSLFLYFSMISVIVAGEPRFRNPVEPYLIIFASAGIFAIYDNFKNKLLSCSVLGLIIMMNFLLYVYSDLILYWISKLSSRFLI